jgi:hypothetical protein
VGWLTGHWQTTKIVAQKPLEGLRVMECVGEEQQRTLQLFGLQVGQAGRRGGEQGPVGERGVAMAGDAGREVPGGRASLSLAR